MGIEMLVERHDYGGDLLARVMLGMILYSSVDTRASALLWRILRAPILLMI